MKEALASLRDVSAFAFVMLNSIFVLIVFLLQLKKSLLHIQWPFNAVNYIIFDASNQEVIIKREYLELEPIGLLFVLFFGVILLVQFIAMLMHRFSTISQILATTKLNCYCKKNYDNVSPEDELSMHSIEIARIWQKPKPQWDESGDKEQQKIERRDTISKILHQHQNRQDYSNLEANFKAKFGKLRLTDLWKLSININEIIIFIQQKTLTKISNGLPLADKL